VAIPAIAGLVAWVMPVRQTTPFHRFWLFVAGVALSGLIYLQQWETRVAHSQEMAKLATKEDIANSAADIVKEFQKSQTQEVSRSPGVPPTMPKSSQKNEQASKGTHENPDKVQNDTNSFSKGIQELKSLIVGQHWGLNADQLVVLSQRMLPFAATVNTWQGGDDMVTAILGNQDSMKFAFNLVMALRSAGWNLPGSGFSQAIFTGYPTGFIIQIHSREDATMPIVKQLVATMQQDNIQVHGEIADKVPPGQCRMIVGAKPE
jgi:hypothetical protein